MARNVLIIIDVQNDFCPGGALEVPYGDEIIEIINKISPKFDKVIATQDWHPKNHISFASTHNKKIFDTIETTYGTQILWPSHCVQESKGAEFHKKLNLKPVDLIIRKGTDVNLDSYSAFLENDKKTETGLQYYLQGLNITKVYICGLATDFCVFYSAMDAKNFGFNTYVILDACKGVDVPKNNVKKALDEMKKNHIKIITSSEI